MENFKNIAGHGIIGKIEGEEILLGNSKMLDEYKIQNDYKHDEKRLAENGNSIIYAVKNKQLLGIIRSK